MVTRTLDTAGLNPPATAIIAGGFLPLTRFAATSKMPR